MRVPRPVWTGRPRVASGPLTAPQLFANGLDSAAEALALGALGLFAGMTTDRDDNTNLTDYVDAQFGRPTEPAAIPEDSARADGLKVVARAQSESGDQP